MVASAGNSHAPWCEKGCWPLTGLPPSGSHILLASKVYQHCNDYLVSCGRTSWFWQILQGIPSSNSSNSQVKLWQAHRQSQISPFSAYLPLPSSAPMDRPRPKYLQVVRHSWHCFLEGLEVYPPWLELISMAMALLGLLVVLRFVVKIWSCRSSQLRNLESLVSLFHQNTHSICN